MLIVAEFAAELIDYLLDDGSGSDGGGLKLIGLLTKTGAAVCCTDGDSTKEGADVVFGGITRA